MRIFWIKAKDFCKAVLAAILSIVILLLVYFVKSSPFSFLSGVRTYYLYSPSSQAKITQTLRFSELFSVKGESVAVDLSSGTPKSVMERLLKETGAEVVLVEKVGGVQSYYCHSKRLGETVLVGGYAVNLHVAINEEETRMVVGTPIIFGGY